MVRAIRVRVASPPTPGMLHARGMTYLLTSDRRGSVEHAVRDLAIAAALAPHDRALASDLAAAYLLCADSTGEPWDLVLALGASEAAAAPSPAAPEALFNRALILEKLYLRGEARQAWELYLRRDPFSGWALEAREHLRRLRQPVRAELWSARVAALRTAALPGDATALRALVEILPQAAREHAVEEVLGEWGDLAAAGRNREARDRLATARAIGDALAALTGEETVARSVAAIDQAEWSPAGAGALAALARGHRLYRLGSAHFRKLEIGPAAPLLMEAGKALRRGGSPVALWAAASLAGVESYRGHIDLAVRQFDEALRRVMPLQCVALVGRIEWGLGWTAVRAGRFGEALHHYGAAAAAFAKARETENQGAVEELMAEALGLLGQGEPSWEHRHRALAELSEFPSSIRLHTALWEAANAALRGGQAAAAKVLQDEGVGVALSARQPRMLAEALLWRSKIQLALDQPPLAFADLRDAAAWNAASEAGEIRRRVEADITLAEGEALRHQRRYPEAAARFAGALRYYTQHGLALNTAAAYLGCARSSLAAQDDAAAEADLRAAIALYESESASLVDGTLVASFAETAQELFDEMILLQALRRGRPDLGLELSERARDLPWQIALASPRGPAASPRNVGAAPLAGRLRWLPQDVAIVEYAWVREHLLTWIVRNSGILFTDRTVETRRLEEEVRAFAEAARRGAPAAQLDSLGRDLWEALIPEPVRRLPRDVALVIVPDKSLNEIPFAALRDPAASRFLVEERTISLAPAAGVYLASRPQSRQRRAAGSWHALLVGKPTSSRDLSAALPDLPGAETEVKEVGHLYPHATILLGKSATRTDVLRALDRCEVFHFAGHAVNNARDPQRSYLLVASGAAPADDGVLLGREVAALRFSRLRLVVLDACDTLGARDARATGVSGLARSFLTAGAGAVVATLWAVDDEAARQLLPVFHKSFLASQDAAKALRSAQLALLASADPALRSPASWAPFQVVGGFQGIESGKERK
ncbi:MAG TPA: CHAT domain-containing protein [Thermoanaerobaculia bacterium]|nr:CHAT domain-containing protein [Thermoanaerobaculia bacterium]